VNLLVVDTETNDLPDDGGVAIEIAGALFSVTERTVLWSYGGIVPYELENPAQHVNGISSELLRTAEQSIRPDGVVREPAYTLRWLAEGFHVNAIAAHGADFDRRVLNAVDPWWGSWPWICTVDDVSYPKQRSSALAHLAVDHGIAAVQTHRALDDVLLLCQLLAVVEDLDLQVESALQPRSLWKAIVSYDDRQLAKDAGFRWNRDDAPKAWTRWLPEDRDRHPDFPFEVVPV
jgi:DNA polymerase-3 subunit epsilon